MKKNTIYRYIFIIICIPALSFILLFMEKNDSSSKVTEDVATENISSEQNNLVNISTSSFGFWDINGMEIDSDSVKHTDFIPVSHGSTYRISVTFSSPQILLFDQNKQPVKIIEHHDEEGALLDKYVTIDDSRVKYMSINYNPSDEEYIYAYETTVPPTPQNRIKVGFLGDSITEGYMRQGDVVSFTNFSYPSILSTKLNIIPYEYATSGILLCGTNSIINHIESMSNDLDMVIIMVGINDFTGPQVILGDANDTGDTSFCGMLNILFEALNEKYGDIPIVYLTPLEMCYSVNNATNSMGDSLDDYAAAIMDVSGLYDNVSIIDTYSWSKNALVPSDTSVYADGLHPTQLGHYRIADYLYVELIKSGYR